MKTTRQSRSQPKWAVENMNIETGEVVRFMETHQEWVAELMRDQANAQFDSSDRGYQSRVVLV